MKNNHSNARTVLIIGAGAAGLMAGIRAAEKDPNWQVLIAERMERPGRKLLITGKGRCNVTNRCTIEEFMPNVLTNPRFLYSSLNALSPYEVMGFFEECGVPLKVERGERVFPVSDHSSDIVNALVQKAKDSGCRFLYNCRIKELLLEQTDDGQTVRGALTESGEKILADAVIVATGGKSYPATGSTGDGYQLARQAGHRVTPLRPSLIPLVCKEKYCRDMMGLSLKNVTLRVVDTQSGKEVFSELGEMLFTHFGVSGPLVLSASCHMQPDRNGSLERYRLYIDWKPALSIQQLDARILRDFEQFINKDFINSLGQLLPRKAIQPVAKLSGIPFETKINQITREQRLGLVELIKAMPITPVAFRPIEEAIVTAGGVDVAQINPKTMESKLVSGLYFAGEVLDVDGYTGGFNLQIAFSTGYAAGQAFWQAGLTNEDQKMASLPASDWISGLRPACGFAGSFLFPFAALSPNAVLRMGELFGIAAGRRIRLPAALEASAANRCKGIKCFCCDTAGRCGRCNRALSVCFWPVRLYAGARCGAKRPADAGPGEQLSG